jgi:LacI family transcriptional regulator
MRKPNRPTIDDLARHLGVHKSTVSRAMDPARRHLIGARQLQRVDAAAREIGYRPNRVAAALTTGRSGTVGVLMGDVGNPWFAQMLRGIGDALEAEGYITLLACVSRREGDTRSHATVVERMLGQRVEGFVVATAELGDTWLDTLRDNVPTVLVNRTDGRDNLPAVVSDNRLGMKLAVDHLVGLGHRRIVHLAGPARYSTGRERREGFETAMRAHGLGPGTVVECEGYGVEFGHTAMKQLLEAAGARRSRSATTPRPTAVVTANNTMALGALKAMKEHGLAVPAEMSLVAQNDMLGLDQIAPPLTTVRMQHYEMGHRAARLLLDALRATPGSQSTTIVLRPELVVRGSTAPPPA